MSAWSDALGLDFLITALIVVLVPGTGVIYTLSAGVFRGARASVAAAFGCTMGIVPHLAAGIFGLAALLHASAIAFQTLKYLGIAYLLYLAWGLWRQTGALSLTAGGAPVVGGPAAPGPREMGAIALRGGLINIFNPKLSIFFLAFLPQFVPAAAPDGVARMAVLAAVFMAMTFVIFVCYGLAAHGVRRLVVGSERVTRWTHRVFAAAFAGFAARLALSER
jgi:threonine/homoserine/homoserine lactone efflux protein